MNKGRENKHLTLINCEPENSAPIGHPALEGPLPEPNENRAWGGLLSIRLPDGVLPHPSLIEAAKKATGNIAKAEVFLPKILFTFGILGKDKVDANINITKVTDTVLAAAKLPLDFVEREIVFVRGRLHDNSAFNNEDNPDKHNGDPPDDPPPVA